MDLGDLISCVDLDDFEPVLGKILELGEEDLGMIGPIKRTRHPGAAARMRLKL